MSEHIATVKGRRGRGLRSRAAKAAKRAASVAACERRRTSYHGVARRLVAEGLASPDVLDGYRPGTP